MIPSPHPGVVSGFCYREMAKAANKSVDGNLHSTHSLSCSCLCLHCCHCGRCHCHTCCFPRTLPPHHLWFLNFFPCLHSQVGRKSEACQSWPAMISLCWHIALQPCVTDLLLVISHVLTIPCHFQINSLLITHSTQTMPIFFSLQGTT